MTDGDAEYTEVLYYTDGGFEEDAGRDDREIPRYKDEDWMRENYVGTDLSYEDIAEMEGVSPSTVSRHSRRMGFAHRSTEYDLSDVDILEKSPWKDADLLETLYVEKGMSTTDLAVVFECSTATVTNWLEKHGIDRRDLGPAQKQTWGTGPGLAFQTNTRGREVWNLPEGGHVLVHRLMAIAEYGVDEVIDKHIHHINEIKWDNRPQNIELVTNKEHGGKHLKIDGIDRIRVAELYENGEISTRDLADELELDISAATVREIHKEFYRSEAA